jgi:hypothetical protein
VPSPKAPAVANPTTTSAPAPTATHPPPTTTTSTSTLPPATLPPVPPPAKITAAGWIGPGGNGVWVPEGRTAGAVFTTTLVHGGFPIGLAWMDPSRVRLTLYAGYGQPAGSWPNEAAVPRPLWGGLDAAFNSGFKLGQAEGGWSLDGHTAVPLRAGAASFVIYRNGTATVGEWAVEVGMTPDVAAVRQNLVMLVDGEQPTQSAYTSNPIAIWGDPLHENVHTWRSALGVTSKGDLIYAAGPAMLPITLAQAMTAAGAVRAMELDINPEWIAYDTFTGTGQAIVGQKLLATMYFSTTHFLVPYTRDFIAVFVR